MTEIPPPKEEGSSVIGSSSSSSSSRRRRKHDHAHPRAWRAVGRGGRSRLCLPVPVMCNKGGGEEGGVSWCGDDNDAPTFMSGCLWHHPPTRGGLLPRR